MTTKSEISKAASALGKRAAGVPKDYSPEERLRRAEQMRLNVGARVQSKQMPPETVHDGEGVVLSVRNSGEVVSSADTHSCNAVSPEHPKTTPSGILQKMRHPVQMDKGELGQLFAQWCRHIRFVARRGGSILHVGQDMPVKTFQQALELPVMLQAVLYRGTPETVPADRCGQVPLFSTEPCSDPRVGTQQELVQLMEENHGS